MVNHLLPGTHFMQGNEALAEAAIVAGCRFFAGYPITPATEIAEHLAKRLPQVGGVMIQMEDEIASIASVIGASWTGVKAMTATSGPGFSLMQENIGYAFMTETPCVIVDVQRAGPSTGQATKCGQGDVMQSRWGTHGDYAAIVLSPNSVQEMFDLTVRAFNLAERYRTPVVVLSDEIIAHMREQLIIPDPDEVKVVDRKKPQPGYEFFFGGEEVPPMPPVGEGYNVAVTGSTHNEIGMRFTSDIEVHRDLVTRLIGKIRNNVDSLSDFQSFNVDDCEVCFVVFGCTSRAVYEAVSKANESGIKAGYVRLRTLWPFPEAVIQKIAKNTKAIIVPEMNTQQLFFEVQRVVNGYTKITPMNKIGGGEMFTPEELLAEVERIVDENE
ncbi:MAG: 2-oxoacid:acceptor oxidoreductase subunit alpha [Candidatus Bathyarchaeota archaeon]|nr:2-oxoacid:acceptor oxidoreductase subunit alpha [Candidatus Bathyarchaeota archaeon]